MFTKEDFLAVFDEKIKRDGASELRKYLLSSDFFTAPASSRYHCAYEGGLCEHCLNVYYRLLDNVKKEYGETWQEIVSEETIAICALLHDLCKIDFYKIDYRNVKENGEWIKKPYFARDEIMPYGHGEKSVYIISGFMRLTREEAMAINWHMGGFDQRVMGGSYAIADAFYMFPEALLFHIADLQATYLDEHKNWKIKEFKNLLSKVLTL